MQKVPVWPEDALGKIRRVMARLAALRLRTIHLAQAGGPTMQDALYVPWARLNTVLSGRMKVELPLGRGNQQLLLGPGDAFLAESDAWERIDWSGRFELLCIVPRVKYLRISHYEIRHGLPNGKQPSPTYWHSAQAYGPALHHALETLLALLSMGEAALVPAFARPFIQLAQRECLVESPAASGKAARTFEQVKTWLENSFQNEVRRAEVAQQFGLSAAYLSRLFRKSCGVSFHDFLARLRMEHARKLLATTTLTVSRVGLQCGYGDPVHFVRAFRLEHGMPPGRWRERKQGRPHE